MRAVHPPTLLGLPGCLSGWLAGCRCALLHTLQLCRSAVASCRKHIHAQRTTSPPHTDTPCCSALLTHCELSPADQRAAPPPPPPPPLLLLLLLLPIAAAAAAEDDDAGTGAPAAAVLSSSESLSVSDVEDELELDVEVVDASESLPSPLAARAARLALR